jgi:hypothetical protein
MRPRSPTSSLRPGKPTAPIRDQEATHFVSVEHGRSHPRRCARDGHQHVSMQPIKPSRWRHTAALGGSERKTRALPRRA